MRGPDAAYQTRACTKQGRDVLFKVSHLHTFVPEKLKGKIMSNKQKEKKVVATYELYDWPEETMRDFWALVDEAKTGSMLARYNLATFMIKSIPGLSKADDFRIITTNILVPKVEVLK